MKRFLFLTFLKSTIMKFTLRMLSIFTILSLSFAFTPVEKSHSPADTLEISTDYCKGWAEGYCEGWKDIKGQFAICPITPLCPLPKLECNEGFRCGYNRGFLAGRRAAKGDGF